MKPHKTKIEIAENSEQGNVRSENQDLTGRATTPLGELYVLADGMGGHKGGAEAAKMTVHGLLNHITGTTVSASIDKIISDAFRVTNKAVYDKAHCGDSATEGMGSTAVLLLIHGAKASVAHVGDSRAYLFRNSKLKQLTKDHTVVQRMVEAGILKPEEAVHHPDSNILERAIGNKPDVEFDITDEFTLLDGDAILLCSDGLSGYATNEEIESLLQHSPTVQEIPDRLIHFALENRGSEDNITVQFVQYGSRNLQPTRHKRYSSITLILCLILAVGLSTVFIFYIMDINKSIPSKKKVHEKLERKSQVPVKNETHKDKQGIVTTTADTVQNPVKDSETSIENKTAE